MYINFRTIVPSIHINRSIIEVTRRFLYDQLIYSTNPFRLTLVLNTAFGRWSIIAPHSIVICYSLTIIFTILNADVLIWYVSTCKPKTFFIEYFRNNEIIMIMMKRLCSFCLFVYVLKWTKKKKKKKKKNTTLSQKYHTVATIPKSNRQIVCKQRGTSIWLTHT
jgi:hypothetical protein